MSLKVDVVEYDGLRLSGLEVTEIAIPGADGQLGILPAHIQMISTVGIGPMKLTTTEGKVMLFSLAGGFLEILGDKVRILTESCEAAEDIDVERAETALKRAIAKLETITPITHPEEHRVTTNAMKRAQTRLAVASDKIPGQ